jgi:hypothetical protein
MNKGRLVAALSLLMLATSAFALSGRAPYVASIVGLGGSAQAEAPAAGRRQSAPSLAARGAGATTAPGAAAAAEPQVINAPRHVVYGLLFREVAAFKKIAREKELKGEDAGFLHRHHKENLKLDDAQTEALARVAEETDREARKLDREARKIIDKGRARHPDGKLKDGESLPPPPAELKALQQQRDAAIMKGREELRSALGDTEFLRFDEFVQQEVTKRMKPVQEDPHPEHSGRAAGRQ